MAIKANHAKRKVVTDGDIMRDATIYLSNDPKRPNARKRAKVVTVTMDLETAAILDRICADENFGTSTVLRAMVRKYA